MRINADYLREHFKTGQLDRFRFKKVPYFLAKENETKLKNKGVWGIVLKVTAPSPVNQNYSRDNKRGRTSYQAPKAYHRWILCADLLNPPHTFAIVTHTVGNSRDFLQHVMSESLIGLPFYFCEPTMSESRVSNYLRIIDYQEGDELIPLRSCGTRRPVPVTAPANGDSTFFFVLEGQEIKICNIRALFNSCVGVQCDRQSGSDACSCVKPGLGDPFVYKFQLAYPAERKIFRTDKHVTQFASLKTTSVFFDNITDYTTKMTKPDEMEVKERRYSQTANMCEKINTNGGWKVIGWCKRGVIQLEGEAEKVTNDEPKFHLSSVYPQNEGYMSNEEFRGLQITADYGIPDVLLPNLHPSYFEPMPIESDSDDDDDSLSHIVTMKKPAASNKTRAVENATVPDTELPDVVADAAKVASKPKNNGDDDDESLDGRKKTDPKARNVTPDSGEKGGGLFDSDEESSSDAKFKGLYVDEVEEYLRKKSK